MGSIVLDILDNQDFSAIRTTPNFSNTLFENTWENSIDNSPNKKEAALRNTKLLYEAR